MDLKRYECEPKASISITSALVSALLEWVLIFMLFIDASFAYLVTRFARYSQLQIPCLLCSRLDHVMGNERAGFYWDLFCHSHKFKMSSLILCQLHDNLVDVHGTCENCFFSFVKVNKSNAETYRLLVGKLGAEPHSRGASVTTKCSCCNEQRISKSIDSDNLKSKLERMLEMESLVHDTVAKHVLQQEPQTITLADCSVHPIPSCNVASEVPLGHGLEELKWQQALHDNDVNAPSELISFAEAIPSPRILESHYDESKETSDSFSNEMGKKVRIEIREASNMGNDSTGTTESSKEVTVKSAETSVFESNSTPANEIQFDSKPNDSFSKVSRKEVHIKVREAYNTGNDSTGTTELCKQVTVERAITSRVENDPTPVNEIQFDSKPKVHIEGIEASNKGNETPLECSETSKAESSSTPSNETQSDSKPNETESSDLGESYKLTLGARRRQLSGKLLEQKRSMKDSIRASEDVKLLLSQLSSSRGIEISSNDTSPRVSANNEVLSQVYQRRISLERNESNLSLDGTTITEIEGESVVDQLKRQVEHDKKIMGGLYKELEEERNASAIAANQAMAMITRLQEEKAAIHMEALQYLRMMEEQAEYDGEALQEANEMLAEREKQIQDFEYEIELYKNQLEDNDDNFVKSQTVSHSPGNDDKRGTINPQDVNSRKISLLHFEEEKQYILLCVEKLERKLFYELLKDVGNSEENDGKDKNHLPRDQNEDKLRNNQISSDDLYSLRDELYDINNRLEALEAEQKIIQCSINSLEKGSAGFEFIQEIALRLRELHSAQTRTRNEDLTCIS